MDTSAFPSCCGASIVKGLDSGKIGQDYFYPTYNAKNTHKDLRRLLNVHKKPVYHSYNPAGGLTILITNERQEWMKDILLEEGFIPLVERFFNPIHGNYLTLWGYITHPEQKQKLSLKPSSQAQLNSLLDSLKNNKPYENVLKPGEFMKKEPEALPAVKTADSTNNDGYLKIIDDTVVEMEPGQVYKINFDYGAAQVEYNKAMARVK